MCVLECGESGYWWNNGGRCCQRKSVLVVEVFEKENVFVASICYVTDICVMKVSIKIFYPLKGSSVN